MKDELKKHLPASDRGARTGWKSAGIRRLATKAQRVILTGYVRRSLLPAPVPLRGAVCISFAL